MKSLVSEAAILRTGDLSRSFGGVHALRNVSLNVQHGELHGLIGPNGAGKSTLFHLISGHIPPSGGTVWFNGQDITSSSPHERALGGISIVFQGARIFSGMTVLENVMVGAHAQHSYGFHDAILRTRKFKHQEDAIRKRARVALHQVDLLPYAQSNAETLPLGGQRRMQVARSLCSDSRLLLLDEPASGLRGDERDVLARSISRLRELGKTIVLIEHDVRFVMQLCDNITVLDLGEVISTGTPAAVRSDRRVIDAYLGVGDQHAGG